MINRGNKILIKNNKGGVGKSLITYWLAKGLAELGNKTLILTSDNQNNILTYAGVTISIDKGLTSWLEYGTGELVKLSNNLYYIPLCEYKLKRNFEKKFEKLLNNLDEKYDYILIDASPVVGIDNVFIKISDKIIIPTFLDEVSTQGIINMFEIVPKEKVKAIIPNRTLKGKTQEKYYQMLLKELELYNIRVTKPIPQTNYILNLINKGKSIWDTKAHKFIDIQKIFAEILEVIIDE